jgi:hypothetical protein
MEIKEKVNRFGKYYKVSAVLQVSAFSFKVNSEAINLSDISKEWKIKRSQMIKILQITKPEDWFFKSNYHFDSQTDGIEYDEEDYRIANEELIKWIIEQLKNIKSYTIKYLEDLNIFKFHSYTQSFNLKPNFNLPISLIK